MVKQNGFTLVELAIALMVIGLLIGGVLKGQELIQNARMTATIRQIKAYDTAAMIFKNSYGDLPGDLKRPNRIPNCSTAICNTPGNGNGRVFFADTTPAGIEEANFFPHLTKAGMIQGPEGGDVAQMQAAEADWASDANELFTPIFPYDTIKMFRLTYGTFLHGQQLHYYRMFTITVKQSMALDGKIDDGESSSGTIMVDDGSDCAYDVSTDSDGPDYACGLAIQAGF